MFRYPGMYFDCHWNQTCSFSASTPDAFTRWNMVSTLRVMKATCHALQGWGLTENPWATWARKKKIYEPSPISTSPILRVKLTCSSAWPILMYHNNFFSNILHMVNFFQNKVWLTDTIKRKPEWKGAHISGGGLENPISHLGKQYNDFRPPRPLLTCPGRVGECQIPSLHYIC